MKNRFIQWAVSGLVIATILCLPASLHAQFNPPRIIHVLHALDTGGLPDSLANMVSFYINKGVETNINRGDILNVYRERNLDPSIQRPLRIFIGTMTVTDSQPGSSVGRFLSNEAALSSPLIRYKTPLKNDIVVPRLIIDSEVLFGPGKAALKKGAETELESVALFIKHFSPSKLVIEGHTDGDGEADYNQRLSEDRAKSVRLLLVSNPLYEEFVTEQMVVAVGYGEERPIVPNDSDINKALNRRIEIIVWE
jgi:outer membrane protein OmpA-like peptidoglycan-associated protein